MACGATLSLKRSLEFDPLHSPSSRSPKRRRCMPMTLSPSATKQQCNPSPFSDVTPKLTSDQIAAQISAEIKRMHRRKQLHYPMSPSCSPPHSGSNTPPHPSQTTHINTSDLLASSSQMVSQSGSSAILFNHLSPNKRDIPLFTLKQVGLVCERMLKEREAEIQQYEAFLKFNHDQLARRFGESAASCKYTVFIQQFVGDGKDA
ncbi:hypothetical protein LSH36_261g02016 [Paralvinella palmiformis]|uniref:Akirin n=1 Tax=Paralvinella palmiformis TaxID=53620 RepID=A0AAD9JKH9_9ANNE|nr:hypothetical protein LSH36_261g02016 [Paralvinella palmiformis]